MKSRLTTRESAFVREFMAIRREVSAAERARLPSVRDMADRMNLSLQYFYRIAAGQQPKSSSHRDVSRETISRAEQAA